MAQHLKNLHTLGKEEKIRLLAEMENLRKRFEREKVETIKFGSINLARDILSPGDNLERALDALPEDENHPESIKNLIDGLKMVLKEYKSTLEKHGVKKIEALNQKFDRDANQEAIKMLDAAIEADKTNPLPYSWKACTIGQAMFLGFRDQDEKTMSEFLGALSKANEMNDNDWNTNRILAEAHITLQDYSQAKVYATRAYKANPNNPHVMSAYGDALLRNDEVETAIKIFKKMYSVEPIPASDTNEDRPKKALMFAYYLNQQFHEAIGVFNEIEEPDFRSWLICVDIKTKQGLAFLKEKWFEDGLRKFKNTDLNTEINRFHLPDKNHKSELISFSESIFT